MAGVRLEGAPSCQSRCSRWNGCRSLMARTRINGWLIPQRTHTRTPECSCLGLRHVFGFFIPCGTTPRRPTKSEHTMISTENPPRESRRTLARSSSKLAVWILESDSAARSYVPLWAVCYGATTPIASITQPCGAQSPSSVPPPWIVAYASVPSSTSHNPKILLFPPEIIVW
jgi:hypothetical protein